MPTDQILELLRDRDRLLVENKRLHERLEALEEIRQRMAEGWGTIHYSDGTGAWAAEDIEEPMPDEVAAVLWPSTEDDISG